MIIWLASYPRSGNTLLRTVFHQTMGLHSLPERTEWPRLLQSEFSPNENSQTFGEIHPEMPWEEFYPMATASEQVHLVKTHEGPIDDQPALYVVRNGRKAIYSYLQYHQKLLPEIGRNLIELVTGHDYYGDWSSHYQAWNDESVSAPRLLVRFEDLREGSPELLQRLASFVSHVPEPRPWENPFAMLQQREPHVFREGKSRWERPEEWTQEADWLFSMFHGQLMSTLGYGEADMEPNTDVWEAWKAQAANTAVQCLDSSAMTHQSVRRTEAQTALLRARLQL
jgi:hypothetical protein